MLSVKFYNNNNNNKKKTEEKRRIKLPNYILLFQALR